MSLAWNIWEGQHDTPDQKKRQTSAQKAECTPSTVDALACSGVFAGSSTYTTTLETCTCIDFSRRHLPCKHMYRLAMELGLLDGCLKSDATKTKGYIATHSLSLEDAVDLLETTSTKSQKAFQTLLGQFLFRDDKPEKISVDDLSLIKQLLDINFLDYLSTEYDISTLGHAALDSRTEPFLSVGGYKKSWKLPEKRDWILHNLSDHISAIGVQKNYVSLNESLQKAKRKLHTYLARKYEMTGAIHIATLGLFGSDSSLRYTFPDDEITQLLNKHNVNPLLVLK